MPPIAAHDPPAAEVIALSPGPANMLEGAWPDRRFPAVSRLELHAFRLPEGLSRARALIFAGGGYHALMHDREGVEIALWLNGLGVDAFVVVHRLPGQPRNEGGVWPADIALRDGLACLDWLAAQDESQDQRPLILVGLSSGGHLAGVMSCQNHPLMAKGVLIAYAPVNANHRDHKSPPGKPDYPPPEKQAFYDAWPVGIAAHPHAMPLMPVFLAYALHDQAVPIDHALNLVRGVQATGGRVDAHIFADAPHGFALRDLSGGHRAWPVLASAWIDGVLRGK